MFSKSFEIKKARNFSKGFCFVLDYGGKLTMTQIECFEWPLKLRNSLIYYSPEISWWSKNFLSYFSRNFPTPVLKMATVHPLLRSFPLAGPAALPKLLPTAWLSTPRPARQPRVPHFPELSRAWASQLPSTSPNLATIREEWARTKPITTTSTHWKQLQRERVRCFEYGFTYLFTIGSYKIDFHW